MRRLSLCLALFCPLLLAAEPVWQTQSYAPAPVDNPLKGLVPYASANRKDAFPHSMEFSYFPLSAVLKGPGRFDWDEIERFLEAVASRGHQAVLRFYLEYPGKTSGMPDFLSEQGVALTRWERGSTPPRPPVAVLTPDYRNPLLHQTLTEFIAAFGQRYDGDARIGFITAGLLGLWGEWHDYPRRELFADKTLQQQVMAAYTRAFPTTPILLRYPAGESDPVYVANAGAAFGFHDDSFAWNTLPTKTHYFVAKLQSAGATQQWQTRPIGGEIRPEAWGKVFDAEPGLANLQDFAECVHATHVSWLMDSGLFKADNPSERQTRALDQVRRMGYEFHVAAVALSQEDGAVHIQARIENRGVAPFYYRWPLEWALLDAKGQLRRQQRTATDLTGLLPGAPARELHHDFTGLTNGHYRVLLRLPNALPNGAPVRFANARQDADRPGWLSLGQIQLGQ